MFRKFLKSELKRFKKGIGKWIGGLKEGLAIAWKVWWKIALVLIPLGWLFGTIQLKVLLLECAVILLYLVRRRYLRFCEEHEDENDAENEDEE